MIHNITIKGKSCKVEYLTSLSFEDAKNARETGNGMNEGGIITIEQYTNFYEIFKFAENSRKLTRVF